jgi:hypothetical protein
MKTRTRWLLLAISLLLAACTSIEAKTPQAYAGPPPDRRCRSLTNANNVDKNVCVVLVSVKGDCSQAGDVSTDSNYLAALTGNTDIRIIWVVFAMGYEFDQTSGVAFKNPQNEFTPGAKGGHFYVWKDSNPTTGTPRPFPYTVQLTRKKDGVSCAPLDPVIINDF